MNCSLGENIWTFHCPVVERSKNPNGAGRKQWLVKKIHQKAIIKREYRVPMHCSVFTVVKNMDKNDSTVQTSRRILWNLVIILVNDMDRDLIH